MAWALTCFPYQGGNYVLRGEAYKLPGRGGAPLNTIYIS
jgi:hypothetical protein